MSDNGNILSSDSSLENESSTFDDQIDYERYSRIWDTLGKSFNNAKVFHILNFLVILITDLLMNVHCYHFFAHMLDWLSEDYDGWCI